MDMDPLEITRATEDPGVTWAPAVGFSLTTLPTAIVLLGALVNGPACRPADWMAEVAAACVWPMTFGTETVTAAPSETTRLTDDPELTAVPAVGLSLITLPAATVVLLAVVTMATKLTAWMAVVAAACVCPITCGTATFAGPLDTTRFTDDPELTEVPAVGVSLITLPAATVVLLAMVTVATKLTAWMAVVAAACVCPITFGTATKAGAPLDTTRFTEEPALIFAAALGFSLITLPAATVLLVAVVTVPTAKPAFWMEYAATACGRPTTLGTEREPPRPVDTTTSTGVPVFTNTDLDETGF